MISFAELYATAALHKGGEGALEALLPKPKSSVELQTLGDDRYLSAMSLRIFQAGLKHDMVAAKWPAFEQEFKQFEPFYCAHLSDEAIEQAMTKPALIRHLGKLKAIRTNAQMVLEAGRQHGSFAKFIGAWPEADIVGLWAWLKQHGAQLGGASGARFLRAVGKDTFLLTDDVVAVLKAQGVVSKAPTSKKELTQVGEAFNRWREESGRALCEISRVLSITTR